MKTERRVKSHILEKIIGTFMFLLGFAAVYIFATAMKTGKPDPTVAILEVLIIVIMGMFAQTLVLIRIYEQNQEKNVK